MFVTFEYIHFYIWFLISNQLIFYVSNIFCKRWIIISESNQIKDKVCILDPQLNFQKYSIQIFGDRVHVVSNTRIRNAYALIEFLRFYR